MINANPANVLPTPFSTDFNKSIGFIPKTNPVRMATINNDKKGFTFLIDKKIYKPMAAKIMKMAICCAYVNY